MRSPDTCGIPGLRALAAKSGWSFALVADGRKPNATIATVTNADRACIMVKSP